MPERIFLRRVAFMLSGDGSPGLLYADQSTTESTVAAVSRSLARRFERAGLQNHNLTLWWLECLEGNHGHNDVYTAKWFDSKRDVFCEEKVTLDVVHTTPRKGV